MKEGMFGDSTAEMLKTTELIYLILSQDDCCLKSKVLSNMDLMKENFEQTIQNYIFSDISVDELASKCNRSLTSFKKEFRKHFYEPPHKWFISSTVDALTSASDLDKQVDIGDRKRMYLSEHVTFH